MRALTFLYLFLASPLAAYEVVAVGIYCPEKPEGVRVDAPGTELGWVRRGGRSGLFDVPGRYVPAEHNLTFGVIFQVPPDALGGKAELVMTHPPLGTHKVTRQSHEVVLTPGAMQGINWVFEFDYERVQGRWTRSLEVDGQTVWTVDFDVGPAGSNPMVNTICFSDIPIS